jgi:hypothetical protein
MKKTYAVYRRGERIGHVKAENLREAEKKARREYGSGTTVAIN